MSGAPDFDPRRDLHHPNPAMVEFQVSEIFDGRWYVGGPIELGPGAVVLDIGANIGVAASFFAAECGAAEVHSFEPIPAIYELLRRNLARFEACRTYNHGLGSASGPAEFTYYPRNDAMSSRFADPDGDEVLVRQAMLNVGTRPEYCDALLQGHFEVESIECPIRTLAEVIAELAAPRIDLLKIDVERAEEDVLAGLDDPAWRRIDQVVLEVEQIDGEIERIETLLESRGFRLERAQEPQMAQTGVYYLYGSCRGGAER